MAIRAEKKRISGEKAELKKNLTVKPTIYKNDEETEMVTQIAMPLKFDWYLTVLNAKPPFKAHITEVSTRGLNASSKWAVCRTKVENGENLELILQISSAMPPISRTAELIFKAFIPGFGQPILVKKISGIQIGREKISSFLLTYCLFFNTIKQYKRSVA